MRLGWIGSGFVGQVAHLANFSDLPDVDIVALAELRSGLGRRVGERLGIQRLYSSHRELLEDRDLKLDGVVAIVRREHTASVAADVLRAGLPLFTEKPMAPTVDQGAMLVAEAERANVPYATGFMRRHDDGVKLAKSSFRELVESGEIGDPIFLRAYCFGGGDYCNISGFVKTDEPAPRHRLLPIAPEWVPVKIEREYESFVNVFVHDFNLIRFLTDEQPTVQSVDYGRTSGVINLEFGRFPGVFEYAHLQTSRYWEEGIDIIFSMGRIRLELTPAFLRNQPARVEVMKEDRTGQSSILSPTAGWTWAFRNQAMAFVKNVAEGTRPIASGKDSLNDLLLIEEIWKKIILNP